MILDEEAYLEHYGTKRKSGRYPWGSGATQAARNRSFLDDVARLKSEGLSETQIAKGLGMTTTQLRAAKSISVTEEKQDKVRQAQRLKDKGMSISAIGREMGVNESSVRSLLAPGHSDRLNALDVTTNMLRDQVSEKGYIDVGAGVSNHLAVSPDKLKVAIAALQAEGYKMHYMKVEQLGTGNETRLKILGKPDSPYPKKEQVRGITERSDDGGRTFYGIQTPLSVSSKRIGVRYAEDGGADADGVIYVRPGVKDVSIGEKRYAQVRVAVEGTHYLKGMAVYKNDLPPGVDLVFNTNKTNTGNKLDAMKGLKDDPDNPFGSIVRQIHGPDGKVSSAMNIVGQKEGSGVEGGWGTWSKSLSSQVLSKQAPELAKAQLAMTHERKKSELDEIMALTNPTVRRKLLESFADDADSSAVHLKAAALPGQATHVILPVNSMKQNEIFAPNYNNGDRVALIRYPHGGTFEIPELTVNNRNRGAIELLGKSPLDAVGIHHKVAERLSGADFDGDTVLVIPNHKGSIKSTPPLDGLKGFDPQIYKIPPDSNVPRMKASNKQRQMGDITNLIADMTIRGANTTELARAVRHSMVVIDAEKHGLNHRASARDNGIGALKEKYQEGANRGASTLVTRAKSDIRVAERKQGFKIDPATGKKIYTNTGTEYVGKNGKTIVKTQKSARLAETDDARGLSSGTRIEGIYADHSNRLKALANTARKEQVATKSIPYNPSAKRIYSKEVGDLNAKLNIALKNAPLERQAQLLANVVVEQKRKANPEMDNAELRKVKAQALQEARTRTGAGKERVSITQAEWNAIQAGAISNHKLGQILNNGDIDQVKKLATPKTPLLMTSSKKTRAAQMLKNGATQAEVAAALGVSVTTLKTNL